MEHCSIVEYFAEHEGYRCGYCKSTDTNYSHGMWTHCLTVQDYQDLIDRGWRRSGKYCYKPTMNLTCCPQYTIRCEALKIKLSRSQKNVIKKVNKYVVCGKKEQEHADSDSSQSSSTLPSDADVEQQKAKALEGKVASGEVLKVYSKDPQVADNDKLGPSPSSLPSSQNHVSGTRLEQDGKDVRQDVSVKKLPKPGEGFDASKPPCKKAKHLRLQRREEKLQAKLQKGIKINEKPIKAPQNKEKTLEEFLDECNVGDAKNKLECRMVCSNPPSEQLVETLDASYAVYRKYQVTIHNDPPDKCKMSQFKRFLVDSPLEKCTPEDGPPCGYGSFHQQYWLDGKLIAVGVLDVLPHSVSSVYFYYDPDYRFLGLGTYASLRELALTREFYQYSPELQFYYMGFYIHSCPKMRYKGNYHPSYLLCPDAYTWNPIERCITKLDASKYSRLEQDKDAVDPAQDNVNDVLILYEHVAMPFSLYKALARNSVNEAEVKQYLGFVGIRCAKRMLLYRS